MAKPQSTGLDPAQKEFVKLIEENSRRHRRHEVFRDFCELAALSISNAVDRSQFDAREARYMEIVGRYERAEVERFPLMLARITESLTAGMSDCLGQIFGIHTSIVSDGCCGSCSIFTGSGFCPCIGHSLGHRANHRIHWPACGHCA